MTALEALKHYFGYGEFRSGQEELIRGILAGRDVLGIMPTGAGKSVCFQIPALMRDGVTLIVSPLISLMKDQVNALTQSGVPAAFINSSLTQRQIDKALQNARNGAYKLIYVAPERLPTPDFIALARDVKISMLTVDEAHCISQWGQDFRPSYAQIPEFIADLPTRPVVSAFTATATPRVREDIVSLLRLDDPQILITGFDRKNLYFDVRKPKNKYNELTGFLRDKKDRCGIIYCGTRKLVEEVCERLRDDGYNASRYHAGLGDYERRENQDDFLYDRALIMVATNAFGMGIDKSNVSFVVHYNMPKDIESYYQEAGRAGRDGEPADCVLLYSGQDVRMNEWMIENDKDVQYPDKETEEMLKERSRKRLREMTFYSTTADCLRGFILKYFGENPPDYCGNCGCCNMDFEMTDITVDAQQILSCVTRMNERYGSRLIMDVLRGKMTEKVIALGLDSLSTFGINNRQTRQLRAIMDFLIMQKYLFKTSDEYPIIKLGERANDVLRGGVSVQMKLAVEKSPSQFFGDGMDYAVQDDNRRQRRRDRSSVDKTVSIRSVDKNLFESLRALRNEIAREQKVPAYIVFSDSTLTDMCVRLPRTKEDFLDVSGVGDVKLEKYGEPFLNAISEYLRSNDINDANDVVSISAIANDNVDKTLAPPVLDSSAIEITDEPVTVSVIADRINCYLIPLARKKLTGK
ncbi:MAG: DNA helicase RecQ, partial [Chitinispirillales bacterium]|nr:DNA helicase RecQ [Chitinispirillales bacterium]